MLELIFQGFAEWIYGMVLECWEFFCDTLLDIMSMDYAYMKSHIPVINDIRQVVLAVGWALLLGNLVFQAVKSMLSGLGFEGEDPKLLFARTFVFSFLLLASPQICEIGLNMTSTIMALLQVPDAVNVQLVDGSLFGSLTAAWALVIIFDIIIMFKVLKLLIEVAERYVILSMLTITAPLAFATGGSRNTSDIFSGWCRMYGSMCLLMCINVIFFKMLLSVVSTVPSNVDVIPWMVLILAIVKVAKKADAIITRIGLNPAITGDSLGSRLPGMLAYTVVRTVASDVAKAAKKSAGGTNRGRASGFSPGGSGGGPFGGRGGPGMGAAAGTSGQSGSQYGTTQQRASYQQSTTQQGAVYQDGTQQGAAYQSKTQTSGQPGTTHPGEHQPPDRGQVGRTSFGPATSQAGHMGAQSSRKSSVPPGTRRSPGHVPATESSVSGAMIPGSSGTPSRGATGGAHIMGGIAGSQGKPGTAGTSPQVGGMFKSTAPQPGTAGKSGPRASTRFTQATSQRMQIGDTTAKVQMAEQKAVSLSQKQPSPGAVRPGSQPSGTPAEQKAQPGQTATRFTQRESREVKAGQSSGVSQAAKVAPTISGVQPGTAGMGAVPATEQSSRMTRHSKDGPPQPGGTTHIMQTATSPARQEVGRVSDMATPLVKGGPVQSRPGTAGTASTIQQAAQTRQTARDQTLRGKSTPTATDSLGGKRTTATASAAQKGRLTPKGPMTPKAQQPTRKRADRPPRNGGGGDRGK